MTTNRTSRPVPQPMVNTICMENMVTNWKNLARLTIFKLLQANHTLVHATRARPLLAPPITYQRREPVQGAQPMPPPLIHIPHEPLQHVKQVRVVSGQRAVEQGLVGHSVGVKTSCRWPLVDVLLKNVVRHHFLQPRDEVEDNVGQNKDEEKGGRDAEDHRREEIEGYRVL